MKKWILNFTMLLLLISPRNSFGQQNILFTGNISKFCLKSDSVTIHTSVDFPDSLFRYDAIFIFSGAQSTLSEEHVERLLEFLKSGKGLYLGSENWPLQAESNQLTNLLFSKQVWGNFSQEKAEIAEETGLLSDIDSLAAGTTTVSFPLDYRLKVIAWVEDEPLILAGETFGGQLILDGGYSRFYCENMHAENRDVLLQFIAYLIRE